MVVRVTDVRNGAGDYRSLGDRLLVLDFQAGNPEAFVEIHRRYAGLARHVCLRFLPNPHDADEALQETMIRVFQGLYGFNGRYALQPWIGRIATNVSLDAIRTHARRPQMDDDALDQFEREDPAAGPEEAVERLIERDLVLSVLSDLPDTHRRALILRELEGRSHREIGSAMGISPSQAKALIHRAKGSFRRRWMEKAAERSGIAGIALLPLLWLARVADTVRRVAGKAGHAAQAAQAAAPEVVSQAASSTVVSTAGSGLGERVLAAGMTLIVAGGVTVGAATIAKDRGNEDAPLRAEAQAPAVVVPAPDPDVREAQPRLDEVPPKEAQGPPEVREVPVVAEPDPTVAPTPSTEPLTQPSPEPTPDPDPIEEPSTEPTPAPEDPAYEFALESAFAFSSLCPCNLDVTQDASSLTQDKKGSLDVREKLAVTASAEGATAFDVWIAYEAALSHSSGTLSTTFYVLTADGSWYAFSGSATLASATRTERGVTFVLSGSFQLTSERPSDESATDEVPDSGPLTVTLRTWGEEPILQSAVFSLGN